MPGNKLGAEGGAAVAEAMKSCKQLTIVDLEGMSCLCAVRVCVLPVPVTVVALLLPLFFDGWIVRLTHTLCCALCVCVALCVLMLVLCLLYAPS